MCWRHVGGHVHVLACAPRPPTRASAIAPPTPALGGPGHARAAPALLQEWHPRCQPAGRTSRVAGPVLFACGDYSSRCAHISNPAHQSAHTRADSALFDHGPPPRRALRCVRPVGVRAQSSVGQRARSPAVALLCPRCRPGRGLVRSNAVCRAVEKIFEGRRFNLVRRSSHEITGDFRGKVGDSIS